MWVDWREKERDRERIRRRFCERDGGLFCNMLFIIEASQREEGESGQNAGKTRFSEQSPGQPGEGRSICFCVMCALKWHVCVCRSYTCIAERLCMVQKLYFVFVVVPVIVVIVIAL